MITRAFLLQQSGSERILRAGAVVLLAVLLWILLGIVLSFILRERSRGLRNQLRFLFLPSLVAYVLVREFWAFKLVEGQVPEPTTAFRIAGTALAASSVLLGMSALNLFITPASLKRWLHRDVPALFVDVLRYLLVVISVAVILKIVWGEDVAPLIGALGIGGIVLGLALQEPLGNFFNGLAMLAERPFAIGHWIRVGDGKAGQVEHITWRAVKIRTFDNEYIIYPNSVVSKERVTNFSLPTPVQALRISVGTSYDDPPDVVKAAIREVLAGVPGVLADPAPSIYTTAYADFSVNYEIKFYVGDYGPHRPIQDQVMTRLWYGFRRRGIEIPFPIRHVFHHGAGAPAEAAGIASQAAGAAAAPEAKAPAHAAVDLDGVLAAVPIFEGLSREDLRRIAGGAVVIGFAEGERVIAQGEAGSALYAIVRGTARVALRGSDGTERDVAALKMGDVFGEMSLLTGDPRTASVYATSHLSVAEVGKEALAPVLAEREGLAARMAELMVLRKEGLDRTRASGPVDAARRAEMATSSHTLLGRICAFFGIRDRTNLIP